LLNDGSTGHLGEDNGAYVFTRPHRPRARAARGRAFAWAATTAINGKPYSVASNGQAR
jgi:hypothetical protein